MFKKLDSRVEDVAPVLQKFWENQKQKTLGCDFYLVLTHLGVYCEARWFHVTPPFPELVVGQVVDGDPTAVVAGDVALLRLDVRTFLIVLVKDGAIGSHPVSGIEGQTELLKLIHLFPDIFRS